MWQLREDWLHLKEAMNQPTRLYRKGLLSRPISCCHLVYLICRIMSKLSPKPCDDYCANVEQSYMKWTRRLLWLPRNLRIFHIEDLPRCARVCRPSQSVHHKRAWMLFSSINSFRTCWSAQRYSLAQRGCCGNPYLLKMLQQRYKFVRTSPLICSC